MDKLGAPVAPEPPKYDIFRVYYQNHPDALDLKRAPPIVEKQVIDLTAKPAVNDTRFGGMAPDHPDVARIKPSIGIAVEGAIVARCAADGRKVGDVNELLANGQFRAAEYLLGRELTLDEIKNQYIRKLKTGPQDLQEAKKVASVQAEVKKLTPALAKAKGVKIEDQEEDEDEEDDPALAKLADQHYKRKLMAKASLAWFRGALTSSLQASGHIPADRVDEVFREIVAEGRRLANDPNRQEKLAAIYTRYAIPSADQEELLRATAVPLPEDDVFTNVASDDEEEPLPELLVHDEEEESLPETLLRDFGAREQKYDPHDDVGSQSSVWTGIMKKRYIDLHGKAAFDLQSHTDESEWTREMRERYNALNDDVESLTPTELDVARALGDHPGPKPKDTEIDLWGTPNWEVSNVKDGRGGYTTEQLKFITREMLQKYPQVKEKFAALKSGSSKAAWAQAVREADDAIEHLKAQQAAARPIRPQRPANVADEEAKEGLPAHAPADSPNDVEEPVPLGGHGLKPLTFNPGVKVRNAKDFIPFGRRYLLDQRALLDDDTLILRTPSGFHAPDVKKQELTPALKEFIVGYLQGKPHHTLDMTPEEVEWMKRVWASAKLDRKKKGPVVLRPAPQKTYITKKDINQRLKVLMGEYGVGNDNPELLVEMRALAALAKMRNWLAPDVQAGLEAAL